MDTTVFRPKKLVSERFLKSEEVRHVASRNERAIIKKVWDNPGLPRSDLLHLMGLTQQSIYRIVEQLVDRGIMLLGPPIPGTGRGKPSPTLTLNSKFCVTAGIDLNTDSLGLTVMDLSGNYGSRSIELKSRGRMQVLEMLDKELTDLLNLQGHDRRLLLGIGFGLPGFRVSGTAFNTSEPLADWALIELGPMLSEHFGVPVWVENGANCAAMAEASLGIGRTNFDFAYLSFNYGFGGAIVHQGQLFRGFHGNAGELSGIFDAADNLKRPALALLIERLNNEGYEIRNLRDFKNVFDLNMPGLDEWLEEALPYFNRVINAICAITDPSAIVLGGEIPPELAQKFIDQAEFWNTARYGVNRGVPELFLAQIRTHPAAIGSASLPFADCIF